MSIMSVPVVADSVAWLMGAISGVAPTRGGRFPEIKADTYPVAVPTRHGTVRCTVYRPPATETSRRAVYVNVHGGGFVIRYPEQDDPLCRYLANCAGVVVLNVDYATAPRARFPVAIEQVYDVLQWASSPDREWDGTRLCAGGQSAGGSLVAAAARLSLERGGPRVSLQVLHYPPLDMVTPRNRNRGSGHRSVVRPWMAEVFNTAYIPDPGQRAHRLASPAYGSNGDDISGIAPALVIAAEYDPLTEGAAVYAAKLEAAGSLVEYREVRGVNHGYDILNESEPVTREMYDFIAGHVMRAVGG